MPKDITIIAIETLLAGGFITEDDLLPIIKDGFKKWLKTK